MEYNIKKRKTDASIDVSVFLHKYYFLISVIFTITNKDNGDIIKKEK